MFILTRLMRFSSFIRNFINCILFIFEGLFYKKIFFLDSFFRFNALTSFIKQNYRCSTLFSINLVLLIINFKKDNINVSNLKF